MIPNFQHDCDQCIFLGDFTHNGELLDLYVAFHTFGGGTLIARYGNQGHEYMSVPINIYESYHKDRSSEGMEIMDEVWRRSQTVH